MSCCVMHGQEKYLPVDSDAMSLVDNAKKPLSGAYGTDKPEPERSGVIINAVIYSADLTCPYIEKGWVAYEGETITAVGDCKQKPPTTDDVIDAAGKMLMPGFVNPHWHESFVAPNFETPDDAGIEATAYAEGGNVAALGNLFGFISEVGNRLTAEEALAIARWSLWTQLRSGTTLIGDLGSANTADAMAQAAIELGMRIKVSRWCSDIMLPDTGTKAKIIADTDKQIAETEQLMSKWHGHRSGLVNGLPTVMGTFGSSDQQLKALKSIADAYDCHYAMHLGALRNEDAANLRIFDCTSIRRIADLGLLSNRLMTVHTTYGSDQEFKALRESGVHFCFAPGHYGMLGEKTLSDNNRPAKLLQDGVAIATSTDGDICYTGGMTEAMRAAHLNYNETANTNCCCPPTRALLTGTRNGALALGAPKQGFIAKGASADFVLVEISDWRFKNSAHPLRTHLLTGASHDIKWVMVAGKIVVDDGRSTRFDEVQLWQDFCVAAQTARARIKPNA